MSRRQVTVNPALEQDIKYLLQYYRISGRAKLTQLLTRLVTDKIHELKEKEETKWERKNTKT